MTESTRRSFLIAGATALSAGRVIGANDKANVGVIGVGGRGNDHIKSYATLPNVRIAALCDVNQTNLEVGQAAVKKAAGQQPKGYDDMRKLFADKEIDAVSITTPNHWHALATIWACQAGKDVYCEKPACYNPHEGERMIEVARKTNRMVQIGSQSRSIPHFIKAVQLLRDGVIGKVYMAKGLCYKRRRSIGHKENEPTPLGLNWDMFLGPAPMRPYNELRYRYNWHWFWDTGNGDIGNQGVHQMDIARWGLGEAAWPKSAVSTGGKYVYNDDQETPNTQLATFDYGDKEIVFEVRGLITGGEGNMGRGGSNFVGNIFYGEEGWMEATGGGFSVFKGEKGALAMEEKAVRVDDTALHMSNFLAACQARDHKKLNAELAIGVMSANLCHLANASYRAGRKLAVDAAKGRFTGPGAEEGNAFLTRPKYRAPYVV
jgi:predicted dehydrogenase